MVQIYIQIVLHAKHRQESFSSLQCSVDLVLQLNQSGVVALVAGARWFGRLRGRRAGIIDFVEIAKCKRVAEIIAHIVEDVLVAHHSFLALSAVAFAIALLLLLKRILYAEERTIDGHWNDCDSQNDETHAIVRDGDPFLRGHTAIAYCSQLTRRQFVVHRWAHLPIEIGRGRLDYDADDEDAKYLHRDIHQGGLQSVSLCSP
eukprot:SAG31_NODE_9456_length_1274_cov_1.924255_1_plen_203_part_00